MKFSARSPSLWLGCLGVLAALAIVVLNSVGVGHARLLAALYLVPAAGYTAYRLWTATIDPIAGYLRSSAAGALFAPLILGFDALAATGGASVRMWGWAVLGTLALALSLHNFTGRFRGIGNSSILIQLIAECLLLSALVIVSLWEWFFADAPGTSANPTGVMVLVIVLSTLGSVIAVASVREPHPLFSLLGLCVLPAIYAPAVLLYLQLTGRSEAPAQAFVVLAWALMFGSLLYSVGRSAVVPEVMQVLRTTVIGAAIGIMVGVSVLSLWRDPVVEPLTWVMIAIIVVTMVARDIIQNRRAALMNQALRGQALHDHLTGIANRRALDQWLGDQTGRQLPGMSVLTLDLDQFKDVNDLLGHSIGDELLLATATSLTTVAEAEGSRVYRMGGDEFTVLCPLPSSAAEELAARLIEAVDKSSSTVPGVGRLALGASVGVRHVPERVSTEKLRHALTESSQAMRAAKNAGKGRVQVFDDSLHTDYQRRKVVELRLREQLDQVIAHYQPIVTADGRVVGFEALGRWTDPELGVVSPAEFISVAEHANLIANLGTSILTRAVCEMTAAGHLGRDRFLNVNVSALQLRIPSFVDQVFDLLDAHALPRHQLVLELTESTTLQREGPVGLAMERLVNGGVRLAIDDFGAGATSVGYLSQLPVSSVKIDRSLTNGMQEPSTAGIVRGVIEMCRGLGYTVVLEGIESIEQERLAGAFGVDYLQGWLYSKAVPMEELSATVDRLTARPSTKAPSHHDALVNLALAISGERPDTERGLRNS